MPEVRVFTDTNTILYSHDRRNPQKWQLARDWFRRLGEIDALRLNLQVLNEATNVLLRKNWLPTSATAYAIIDDLAELGDSPVSWPEIDIARRLHDRYGYSWWDCLLLASALELGCTHFISEDLQDEQRIEVGTRALTIVDPFAHSPDHILG